MSIKALEWAAKAPGITRLERTVLKEIANRYNEQKGRAWPSQARMARDTGYSRSSINRGLNGLEKKGLILRIASFDSYTEARTSNRYFLPQYAPDHVPARRTAIKIEQYFELDGTSQTDEWQIADNGPQNLLSLKSPSDLR